MKMTLQRARKVLGVNARANSSEIKSAYRSLAKKHHPDVSGGSSDRFLEINEAFKFLEEYKPSSDFFSDFQERVRGGGITRGRDAMVTLGLGLKAAFLGTKTVLKVDLLGECHHCKGRGNLSGDETRIRCEKCKGRGQVISLVNNFQKMIITCQDCSGRGWKWRDQCTECKGEGSKMIRGKEIPLDVPPRTSTRNLIIQGKGHHGKPSGSLIVQIAVARTEGDFYLSELDIIKRVRVNTMQALLGGPLKVQHLDGSEVSWELPPGSNSQRIVVDPEGGLSRSNRRGAFLLDLVLENPHIADQTTENLRKFCEDNPDLLL